MGNTGPKSQLNQVLSPRAVAQEEKAARRWEKKKKKAWVGWRPRDSLEICQTEIENAAKEIAHNSILEREKDARRVPTQLVAREQGG